MSKEKVELRKEVYMFMEKQGHELKLNLDGNPIPYGIVNHLIASFHEYKMEELSKFSQHDVSRRSEQLCPKCKVPMKPLYDKMACFKCMTHTP